MIEPKILSEPGMGFVKYWLYRDLYDSRVLAMEHNKSLSTSFASRYEAFYLECKKLNSCISRLTHTWKVIPPENVLTDSMAAVYIDKQTITMVVCEILEEKTYIKIIEQLNPIVKRFPVQVNDQFDRINSFYLQAKHAIATVDASYLSKSYTTAAVCNALKEFYPKHRSECMGDSSNVTDFYKMAIDLIKAFGQDEETAEKTANFWILGQTA